MGLLCMHIPKKRVLENWRLLLNNLASYWQFYRSWLSQDTEINKSVWENWPENILQKDDFYYIKPKIIPILKSVIPHIPLKAILFLSINKAQPILTYQLNTMPEVNILWAISNYELETTSLSLSSSSILLTSLSVCF